MNSVLQRKRDFISAQRRQRDAIVRGKPKSSKHDFRTKQEIIHANRVRKVLRDDFDALVYVRFPVVLQLRVNVKPTVLVKTGAMRRDWIFNVRA